MGLPEMIPGTLWSSRRVWVALALLTLAGCTNVPPQHITTDRMDYGQVVAESWKRQTLLNVVRLRYADAPVFLEVSSIINSYMVGGKASASATLPNQIGLDSFGIGADALWSNTPTVSYQPLIGDRFTKSMLQPIPPVAIFQLLQGSWPAEIVLPTVVNSINGLRNSSQGKDADPEFHKLVKTLSRIQRTGGLGIRIEPHKATGPVFIVLGNSESAALTQDRHQVRNLLKLEENVGEFGITYGLFPRNRREVAMLSRSMMEVMLQLGHGIELPETHKTNGKAHPGFAKPGDNQATPLVRIHSGKNAPASTYAAIQYKDYWYWIDDNDFMSKRTFTFLLILFSLAETGQSVASPVVTIPSR